MQKMKKVLAILLTLSMVLSYVPMPALAEEETCAHHTHDENCGYEVTGVCSYSCDQCGQEASACTGLSDCSADTHGDTCAKKLADDQAAAEAAAKLAAEQAAAEEAAKLAAEQAAAEQEAAEKAAADKAAADAVAALIDALPSLEEIQAKPMEEQGVDYNQVYAAYDAYGKLTEEQKALLPPAEDVFKPYFDYFSSPTEEAAATSGRCGDNLTWNFDEATGTLTISGTGKMYDYSVSTYGPWYSYGEKIVSIVLPKGVTSVGNYAFYGCDGLTSVTIPDGVTSIGIYAFGFCKEMTGVIIPDSVTNIAENAFSYCTSLTSVTIPGNVTSIGNSAFSFCSGLASVTLSDGVIGINDGAFKYCSSLNSVAIPTSVTHIGSSVFSNCNSLTDVYYGGAEIQWNDITIDSYNDFLLNAAIHYADPCKDGHAFADGSCSRCRLVGGYCGNPDINDGKDVIWYLLSSTLTISGKGDMRDFSEKEAPWYNSYHYGFTSVVIQDGVTSVGKKAFYFWEYLQNVTIPSSVTRIGDYAFEYCYNLSNVTIEEGVTEIGSYAFYYCNEKLTSIKLPSSVTHIGYGAFSYCHSLESIELGAGVTRIDRDVFIESRALKDIYFRGTEAQWNAISIDYYNEQLRKATVHFILPCTSGHAFGSDHVCTNCGAIGGTCGDTLSWFFEEDTLTISGSGAMENYESSAETPWAAYAESITTIVLPEELTTIGDWAFADLTELSSITVPDSVVSIGECAFKWCSKLESVDLGDGCSLSDEVFWNCPVETLQLGQSASFGENAFNSSNLVSITISADTASFDDGAFWSCANLKEVHFTGSAPQRIKEKDVGSETSLASFGDVTFYYKCDQESWTTGDFYNAQNKTWARYKLVAEHEEVIDPAVAATCTNTGLTEGKHCSACGEVLVAQETVPAAHNVVNGVCATCGVYGICGDPEVNDGNDVIWEFDAETGTLTISGTGDMTEFSSNANIPWYEYRTQISSVIVASGVTSISRIAFSGCSALTRVNIAASVKAIGSYAFSDCTSLENITIPAGVSSLGSGVFKNCTALSWIYIPASVTQITATSSGTSLFNGCSSTLKVYCAATSRMSGWGTYWSYYGNVSYNVGYGCPSLEEAEFWKSLDQNATTVEIPEYVTAIPDHALSGFTKLTQITIPDGTTRIGNKAFSNCKALTWLYIPESVASICADSNYSTGSFYGCDGNLKLYCETETQPDGWDNNWNRFGANSSDVLVAIFDITAEDARFWETLDRTKESIEIPGTVKVVPDYAFSGFDNLKEIHFLGAAPAFGANAFSGADITAYYPKSDSSWTTITANSYGGNVEWVGYPVDMTSGTCGENLTWSFDESTGTLIISGTGEMKDFEEYKQMPWKEYRTQIKKVVIGEGITSIGECCFAEHSAMESLELASTVSSIGEYAFVDCSALEKVDLKNVTYIDENAFNSCSKLTQVAMARVEYIWHNAFLDCGSLVSLTLPATVKQIGDSAFVRTGLTEVYFDGSLPTMVRADDFDCSFNQNTILYVPCNRNYPSTEYGYTVKNAGHKMVDGECTVCGAAENIGGTWGENLRWSLDADGTLTISGEGQMDSSPTFPWDAYKDDIQTIVIGTGVTTVAGSAFDQYDNLTELILSETVTVIHSDAFKDCSQLEEVELPSSLLMLYGAFSGTAIESIHLGPNVWYFSAANWCGLKKITVDADNENYSAADGILFSKDGKTLLSYPGGKTATSYSVPDGVTEIAGGAFNQHQYLTSINLPNSVDTLNGYAFKGCTSLETVKLSANITAIGSCTFEFCDSLKEIVIPEGVTSIGDYAFSHCSSLKEITIPSTVTSMGSSVFVNDYALEKVIFTGNVPNFATEDPENSKYGTFAFVAVTAYYPAALPDWTEFVQQGYGFNTIWVPYCKNDVHVYDEIVKDEYRKEPATCNAKATYFKSCSVCGVMSTEFFEYGEFGNHTVGENNQCSVCHVYGICGNSGINDGKNVIWEFNETNGTLTISGTGEMNDYGVVNGSGGVQDEPDTENIPWNSYTNQIKSVIIQNNVTYIGNFAFSYCSELASMVIPSSITRIGYGAVVNCFELKDVYYGGTEAEWENLKMTAMGSGQTGFGIATFHYGVTDSNNHWSATTVDATCGNDGYTCQKCACGYTRNKTITEPATGNHNFNYTDNNDGQTHTKQCSQCSYVENAAETHNYTNGKCVCGIKATPVVTAPTANMLTYNGQPQALVTMGETNVGTMKYSLVEDGTYGSIPEATNAGTYTVWYKVEGDDNYNDVVGSVAVTIAPKIVTVPEIEGIDDQYIHTGAAIAPVPTAVKDGIVVIDASEYTVDYENNVAVGAATVKIVDKEGGNYTVSGSKIFQIVAHTHVWSYSMDDDANAIVATCKGEIGICPDPDGGSVKLLKPTNLTYDGTSKDANLEYRGWQPEEVIVTYNNVDRVNVTGQEIVATISVVGAGTQEVYKVVPASINGAALNSTGATYTGTEQKPTVTVAGLAELTDYTVTYHVDMTNAGKKIVTVTGKGNYTGSEELEYTIAPKEITIAAAQIADVTYNPDGYSLNVTGVTFNGAIAGETVTYSAAAVLSGTNAVGNQTATVTVTLKNGNYALATTTYTATVKINKAAARISKAPTANTLTYNGTEQALIQSGAAEGGAMKYRLSQNESYSNMIPTGMNAGSYSVYYMVEGDTNHENSAESSVAVTIAPKVLTNPVFAGVEDTYLYTGNAIVPSFKLMDGITEISTEEYTFSFANNTDVGTATIIISDVTGGNYTVSGSKTFQIEYPKSGTCGENLTWSLAEDGTLTISGEGPMAVILGKEKQPWYASSAQIKKVVVEDGVTSISQEAFMECPNLEEVVISDTVEEIGALAFYSCGRLRSVALPDNLEALEMNMFANCTSLTSLTLPETVKYIGSQVFMGSGLTEIIIPGSVEFIGGLAFADCKILKKVYFEGDPPAIHVGDEGQAGSFENCTLTAYYPASNENWTKSAAMQDYDGEITWEPYGNSAMPGNNLYLEDAALSNETTVWIDGVPYPVQKDNAGKVYVELPEGAEVTNMVTYGFHVGDPKDVHTQYPVSMKVWALKKDESGIYQAHYVKELDNILQYNGSSIRITGNKGIRMITGVESNKKSAMTGAGLAGYKLVEYGTVLAQSSKMDGPLVLGKSYARSNYAYKRGVADPVFAYSGNLVQYTNVLVGFNMDQCAEDIAMRPYMILEDAEGQQMTIYGGTVYRSIGYIAYQNRSVFTPGSAAYNYVWEIIHHVYGDKYDADYKG